MIRRKMPVSELRVLVMGFTFKENCPDTRNTKVADLVRELKTLVGEVIVYDPYADSAEAQHEYGITLQGTMPEGHFDTVILAVRHDKIMALGEKGVRALLKPNGGFAYDLKEVLPIAESDVRL